MPIKADTIMGFRARTKVIVMEILDELGLIKPPKKSTPKPPPDPKKIKKVASILLVLGLASLMFSGSSFALLRPRNMDAVTTNTWTFQSVNVATKLVAADADIVSVSLTGVDINPVVTPNTSLRPVDITYNYAGAVDNAGGVDMDLFGYRVTITQTSSNDDADIGDRGYLQPIRSDLHINGFVDDAYAFYGKIYIDGDSTLNQGYGANLVIDNGAHAVTMDESGNLAGLGISINGSGDVTCGGTGYGKYSGLYINWNQTNALTVDSVATYIGVQSGALLDSAYRVNASGTLINSFHSYNSSGTMTNAMNIEGAHTNAFAFPAEATAPVEAHVADENSTGRIKITVGGVDRYLYYYD